MAVNLAALTMVAVLAGSSTGPTRATGRLVEHPDRHVVDGHRVWQRHRCGDCHTLLGSGSEYGPDLTRVYWRQGADGIRRAVRTPERLTTWRSMPHLPVTDTQMDDLVAFLRWTGSLDLEEPKPEEAPQPAAIALRKIPAGQ
jgi:cytochrome c2